MGGSGSGNYGHAGIPGEVGGSAPGGGGGNDRENKLETKDLSQLPVSTRMNIWLDAPIEERIKLLKNKSFTNGVNIPHPFDEEKTRFKDTKYLQLKKAMTGTTSGFLDEGKLDLFTKNLLLTGKYKQKQYNYEPKYITNREYMNARGYNMDGTPNFTAMVKMK